MRKWTLPTLISIIIMAVILRMRPLFEFNIWGSDSGEYYTLTKGWVENGHIGTNYNGWGLAYPYFPGAEILTGLTHSVTGLDLLLLLKVLIPIVGAMGIGLVFLLGRSVFEDERAGLVAAAMMAVAMPHVFATSHSMPGTLGDFLQILCFLLLIKAYEKPKALVALALASLSIIPTHHLSTFFVLVPVIFITFVREFIRTKAHPVRLPIDLIYIGSFLSATLVYWFVVAVPFKDQIMSKAFGVDPVLLVLVALASLAGAGSLVWFRRRSLHFRYTPRYPHVRREVWMFVIMIGVMAVGFALVATISVPGTSINIAPVAILALIPITLLAALSVLGIGSAEFSRKGFFVLIWYGALGIILLISILTRNTVLIPYRQFQYIFLPLSLLAGWGAVYLSDNTVGIASFTNKPLNIMVASIMLVMVCASAATAYPDKDLLGGFEEGTTDVEMGAVIWCSDSIGPRGNMIATDHRMSSMVFGFASLNATWDSAYHTMHDDLDGARDELRSVDAPKGSERIDYVLIDDPIKEGVALAQWENAKPMSKEALDKFSQPPFQRVYGSNGVEIFFVDVL